MRRSRLQRLACSANAACLLLVLGVVALHVIHAQPNVSDGSSVPFWWEGPQLGDDVDPAPFRLSARTAAGAVLAFCLAAVCDAGFIWGATLFQPLFYVVAGFGLKEGVALAQTAVFGVALASLAFNLFAAHPWDRSRPVVDLDLGLLLAPALLLGVRLGVLLNDLLPDWLIAGLLVALLVYVCRRKAVLGLVLREEEQQQALAEQAAAVIGSRPMPRLRRICTGAAGSSSGDDEPDDGAAGRRGGAAGEAAAPSPLPASTRAVETQHAAPAAQHAWLAGPSSATAARGGEAAPAAAAGESGEPAGAAAAGEAGQGPAHGEGASEGSTPQSAAAAAAPRTPQQRPPASVANLAHQPPPRPHRGEQPGGSTGGSLPPAPAAAPCGWRPPPSLPPLPPPPLSPLASAGGSGGPRVLSLALFPWAKLLSVSLLWLGFLGLAMLDVLIPLCSWYFIAYIAGLFCLAVLLTATFIKLIVVDPLRPASARPGAAAAGACGDLSRMEQGKAPCGDGAEAAPARPPLRRRLALWLGALTGAEPPLEPLKAPGRGAGQQAAGGGGGEGASQRHISLFGRARLQMERQQQLTQPLLSHPRSFPDVAAAAAAAADGAGCGLAPIAAAAAAVAGAAGISSGLCGLAGAGLLVPVLLELRVHPQVAAATSVLLAAMGSGAGAVSFVTEGRLAVGFAALFAAAAVLGRCAGAWLPGAAPRAPRRRASAVVLALAALTGLAAAACASLGLSELMRDLQEHEGLGLRALCSTR